MDSTTRVRSTFLNRILTGNLCDILKNLSHVQIILTKAEANEVSQVKEVTMLIG
jgi:hypothetical protein